jgi:hypothetical protein
VDSTPGYYLPTLPGWATTLQSFTENSEEPELEFEVSLKFGVWDLEFPDAALRASDRHAK